MSDHDYRTSTSERGQIVPDPQPNAYRRAFWIAAVVAVTLAVMATVCEAIALEVRHGQRTEVRELSEPFGSGQKGSSAMPHKRNPVEIGRASCRERVYGLV